jgi:hypothetical protein
MGTMQQSGALMSRVICRPHDALTLKWEARTDPQAFQQSVYMADVELSRPTYHVQIKQGGQGFYGFNYMASVTPWLSAGAEMFYLATQRRSGMGGVLRYTGSKCVATAQVCTLCSPFCSPNLMCPYLFWPMFGHASGRSMQCNHDGFDLMAWLQQRAKERQARIKNISISKLCAHACARECACR